MPLLIPTHALVILGVLFSAGAVILGVLFSAGVAFGVWLIKRHTK